MEKVTYAKEMSETEKVQMVREIIDSKLNDEMKIYSTQRFLLGWESKENMEGFLERINKEF